MAGTSLSIWADDNTVDAVDNYQRHHPDCDSRSDAAHQLLQIAIRETRNPRLYTLKRHALDWTRTLGVAAVIVLLAGFTTPVLSPPDAAIFAIGLVTTAAVLLAVVELARFLDRGNELGDAYASIWRQRGDT